jgi:hypothetical protein
MMKKTCLLFMILLLPIFALSACATTTPRQCNYERPHANYNEDQYRCLKMADMMYQNSGNHKRYPGQGYGSSVTGCMAMLGWVDCR